MVDPKSFESAANVQAAFERRFAGRAGIRGIGLGLNAASDGPAIRVLVADEATAQALPSSFDGLEVVTDIVGEIRTLGGGG